MKTASGNPRLWMTVLVLALVVGVSICESDTYGSKCGDGFPEALTTCGTPKDIVVIYEQSANTIKALSSLKLGAARLLRATSGRCASPYRVHLKRFVSKGSIQNVNSSTQPNEIMNSFAFVQDNLLDAPYCLDNCCCSSTFFNSFPSQIDEFSTAVYFVLLECFNRPSASVLNDLRDRLRNSRVIFLKLRDSYCRDTGADILDLFSDTRFYVESSDVGKIFESISLFYSATQVSGQSASACYNSEIAYTIPSKTRGIGMVLYQGNLNAPPLFVDPSGRNWSSVVRSFVNTSSAGVMAFYPNSCQSGWIAISGRCYLVQSRASTWTAASSTCQKLGATMLSILDSSDAEVLDHPDILRALKSDDSDDVDRLLSSSIWISLHDTGASGEMQWDFLAGFATLKTLNYTNWNTNEPSWTIPFLKRCASLDTRTLKWRVSVCIALMKTVCVRPIYLYDFNADTTNPPTFMQTGLWHTYLDSFTQCTANYYLLF